jgi:hypothetical protein
MTGWRSRAIRRPRALATDPNSVATIGRPSS